MKIIATPELSLHQMLYGLKNGMYRYPEWQRDPVWDEHQILQWQTDLEDGGIRPGVIVMGKYTSSDIQEPFFINDGRQRLGATEALLGRKDMIQHPERLEQILMNNTVCIQQIEYNDAKEAIDSFSKMNKGTPLSPYGFGHATIVYHLENYDSIWKNRIQNLHQILTNASDILSCDKERDIFRDSCYKRDNYVLFFRFVKLMTDLDKTYNSNRRSLSSKERLQKFTFIEKEFANLLLDKGIEIFDEQLDLFKDYIHNISLLYKQEFENIVSNNIYPHEIHARSVYHFGIYCLNNNLSRDTLIDFIRKISAFTHGKTGPTRDNVIKILQGGRTSQSLTFVLSNLSRIKAICRYLDVDITR